MIDPQEPVLHTIPVFLAVQGTRHVDRSWRAPELSSQRFSLLIHKVPSLGVVYKP